MRHAQPHPLAADLAADADDPDLLNVHADMALWLALHPCECEAGCECDTQPEEDPS